MRVRGRGPERNTLFRMVCIVERALAWGPQDADSSRQLRGWVVCSTSLYHPEDKCRMMASTAQPEKHLKWMLRRFCSWPGLGTN